MEIDLLKGKFNMQDANALNPLVLAFVGDAVYEVFVRTFLVSNNRERCVHKLHKNAVEFVKAHAQSEFMKNIQQYLNEKEVSIYKRGRNAKSGTVPKNANVQEYRMATGFEAVIGFLYLTEETERLNYIFKKIVEIYDKQEVKDEFKS
ncbi:Mini-ribonuclease 3 [Clostridium rectalis]|uniref:Mini-ribonuclease 3 n=1 Tax=Clostridium rectalis TaxID=2040295 RepID=UPI000F62ED36|nr:Mini-ribonuclease 3 [Clostridium rectalis]